MKEEHTENKTRFEGSVVIRDKYGRIKYEEQFSPEVNHGNGN